MKKSHIVFAAVLMLLPLGAGAQKKALQHEDFDQWQAVTGVSMSENGQALVYEVNPQEGDGMLTFSRFGKKPQTIAIERGYRGALTPDGRYGICLVKPHFSATRSARIAGKKGDSLPKDSLFVVDLLLGKVVSKFHDVASYKIGRHAGGRFAFATSDTAIVKKKDKAKALLVYTFENAHTDTLRKIAAYEWSVGGKELALVKEVDKKHSLAGFLQGKSFRAMSDTAVFVTCPVFNESGTEALFTMSQDTLDSGSKHCDLYIVKNGTASLLATSGAGVREGWGMTEKTKPYFSHDGSRIFAGIQEYLPPKDTSIHSFEAAELDIWNWDATVLPPMAKVNASKDRDHCLDAVVQGDRLLALGYDKLERIVDIDRGDAVFSMAYKDVDPVETQWNITNPKEIATVSLADGSRKAVATGRFDNISASPSGRYLLWWDHADSNWYAYDTASGAISNLTGGMEHPFWDEKNDRPMAPDAYGHSYWTDNDEAVLLYDRYDVWAVSPTATKRLTQGRESGITFRVAATKDVREDRTVGPQEQLLLTSFDNATKEHGLYSLDMAKGRVLLIENGGNSYSRITKARKADVFTFLRGNFNDPMDLYRLEGRSVKGESKITAINPQQADYNWGTVALYKWRAYDGTPLEGLLYKPEDFDESKKYPVIVYFYETYSEELYTNYVPQPMWSIINIPFFVSRGYVVFVPDIVYHGGIPGECAYNCIVSGAESLTKYPWIDAQHMGIQGQSWGGYQVAYLVTRTGMFAAAGAGAPVSNMTSAYGGIRWESGMSRQFQYEQTQSRIGRDLWNGLELYMENSPVFKLRNCTTPVLIMHNDNDGAVPWYQGIEMFMDLRRLGKPAWLLEYNGEAHNLRQRKNRKDLGRRLQQFFDHYLMGAPQPAWMSSGIPILRKGQYYGFEEMPDQVGHD